uniref:sn-1-specific diacylglycerol lipase ABHD11 n=1 Tax=Panagrellus redivivus TaxID=6233 RepID=A0A7E4VE61_PANRE
MLHSRIHLPVTLKLSIRTLASGNSNPSNPSDPSPVPLAFNHYGSSVDRSHHPLVIGHGLFGHKGNFNAIAKRLQQRLGNQIFAVDMRNHGESPHVPEMTYPHMAADYAHFIESVVKPATGFDQVHLLGHSMGAKTACLLALDSSKANLIKSLIIEDINPVARSQNKRIKFYIQHMKKVNLKQSRRQIGEDFAPIIANRAVRASLLTNLAHIGKNGNQEYRWKLNLDAIETYIDNVLSFTVSDGTFEGPSLFVYGENSEYLNTDDFKAIQRLFPNPRFHVIPKAGHWLHAEQPEAFVDSVVDFIKSVERE